MGKEVQIVCHRTERVREVGEEVVGGEGARRSVEGKCEGCREGEE